MNRFRQRVPAYVELDQEELDKIREGVPFETLSELLLIKFIQYWKNHPDFYQFSVFTERKLLVAEMDRGARWVIIGDLDVVDGLSLPEWEDPNGL